MGLFFKGIGQIHILKLHIKMLYNNMTVHILSYMYINVLDIHVQAVIFYQNLKEILKHTMKALVGMLS